MLRTIQALLTAGVLATAAQAGAEAAAKAATTEATDVACPTFTQASKGLPVRGEWRTYPAVADFNGDGRLDLAATPRKDKGPRAWLSVKDGWKESSLGLALPGYSCGVGLASGDLNGDGHLDLGVADHCHGLFVYFGNGKGSWRPGPQAQVNRGDPGLEDLALGDIDADGDLDIATVGAIEGGVTVYLNDGTGRFAKSDTGLPIRGTAKNVELADVNEDGLLDIAASYSGLGSQPTADPITFNVLWLASKNDEGELRYTRHRAGLPVDTQTRRVIFGDVDLDGHQDLIATFVPHSEGSPLIRVFRGDGAGGFVESSEGLPQFSSEALVQLSGIRLADLNRDGTQDLVAVQTNDDRFHTWMGSASGAWRACGSAEVGITKEGSRSIGLEVADTNADGKPDLVMAFGRVGEGGLEVWLAN